MKKKHRIKFCGKCLKNNEPGTKTCVYCGWTFKRGRIGQMIDKVKRYLQAAGEKRVKS